MGEGHTEVPEPARDPDGVAPLTQTARRHDAGGAGLRSRRATLGSSPWRLLRWTAASVVAVVVVLPALVLSVVPVAPPPSPAASAAASTPSPATPVPAHATTAREARAPRPAAAAPRSPVPEWRRLLAPWAAEITAAADLTHLPPALISAVMLTESGGDAHAVSRAGAQGLMQLEPGTAQALGVQDSFDPWQNVLGGSRYLAALLSLYRLQPVGCRAGDGASSSACQAPLVAALAAYNAGPGAVHRYNGVPPYSETRTYVSRVIANFAKLQGPASSSGGV
jgi:soluble lytic murein transglycosylase-like protein